MKKRGQVTIFLILAIMIVAVVVGFFMFKDELKIYLFNPEVREVQLFVENCVEGIGGEVIYDIGKKGGYFFAPDFSTDTEIPIYYSNGESYMPSKEQIEKEISYYVNKELFFCTRNFVDFPEYEIIQGEIETKTTIEKDKVILDVNYPLSITKENSTALIEDFKDIEIPVRLGVVYDSIYEIIQEQLSHENICLSCILEVSLENDLYIEMMDYDNETVIFIFKDKNCKLNDVAFEFVFANKYKIEE